MFYGEVCQIVLSDILASDIILCNLCLVSDWYGAKIISDEVKALKIVGHQNNIITFLACCVTGGKCNSLSLHIWLDHCKAFSDQVKNNKVDFAYNFPFIHDVLPPDSIMIFIWSSNVQVTTMEHINVNIIWTIVGFLLPDFHTMLIRYSHVH